jgi:hypothetical protein
MYHKLFAYTVYNFYDIELCIMYDSHDAYLCVLLTICIYKFSICHVVVFTVFSFHLPIFDKNRPVFDTQTVKSSRRFFKKRLIYQPNQSIPGFLLISTKFF